MTYHCRTCTQCLKSLTRVVKKAPLVPLPIMDEPFSNGYCGAATTGKRYILVICDYAIRYPEAVALRTIDANAVAEELLEFFSRVGVPEEILTDQGTNFTSQLLSEVYRLLKVKPIRTTPYHPQTDGLVERFNGTLKAMLKSRGGQRLGPATPVPAVCLQGGTPGLYGVLPVRVAVRSQHPGAP